MAEVNLRVGCYGEVLVVGHLLASIPGQGAAQLLREFAHVFTECGYDGRRVLARHFEKHCKASVALNECHDVRVVRSAEKVALPVAWHGAVIGIGRPLADRDGVDNLSQSALRSAALGGASAVPYAGRCAASTDRRRCHAISLRARRPAARPGLCGVVLERFLH